MSRSCFLTFFIILKRFGLSSPVALVELLTFLPEEVSSGHLRLGENRRERAKANLAAAVPALIEYLTVSKFYLRIGVKAVFKLTIF